jgi:hypothetical protein
MSDQHEPVILELAPLPREQTGPFLLLGLPKDADAEAIEANWAKRVIWSRKKQLRIPLEDVNWARETINSPERRIKADILSLNADTMDRALEQLSARFGGNKLRGTTWQPIDREKPLAEYSPATDIPDWREIRATISLPDASWEMPAVSKILSEMIHEPLDPWSFTLSPEPNKGAAE